MPQYITAIAWNEHNRRVAQVWLVGGHKVTEVEMPPQASQDETWDTAVWLYDQIVEQELARDHRDTVQTVLAASYPI